MLYEKGESTFSMREGHKSPAKKKSHTKLSCASKKDRYQSHERMSERRLQTSLFENQFGEERRGKRRAWKFVAARVRISLKNLSSSF